MSKLLTFPQCVGLSGEEAKRIINQQDPTLDTPILPENTPLTKDLRRNRVRIIVDNRGIVTQPRVG